MVKPSENQQVLMNFVYSMSRLTIDSQGKSCCSKIILSTYKNAFYDRSCSYIFYQSLKEIYDIKQAI